jgi:hypothetical protein
VRWRCVDLRAKIADQFSVTFHKRSVAKLLGSICASLNADGRPQRGALAKPATSPEL